jgi:hypothetical protein
MALIIIALKMIWGVYEKSGLSVEITILPLSISPETFLNARML